MGCNGSATVCLNPARFDADVVEYNTAADGVMAAANAVGAKIATADLYSFVLTKYIRISADISLCLQTISARLIPQVNQVRRQGL